MLNEATPEDFGYVSGRGAPALHRALAAYLNRVRGTSASPENVVICNGYAQGVGLVIAALVKAGARRLAVENPSADDDAVPAARAAGLASTPSLGDTRPIGESASGGSTVGSGIDETLKRG